ncbi:MAG: YkgJ family cysteine cluster protein [Halodesulfurarchaeum sp.]
MESLEAALGEARELDMERIAGAIERIGFECTRCGECCRGVGETQHTATIFPAEVRDVMDRTGLQWADVARPMPFGLEGGNGETFEWAIRTDASGDCRFLRENNGEASRGKRDVMDDSTGGCGGRTDSSTACTIYRDRPLICRTYPFSLDLGGMTEPDEAIVAVDWLVQAHECRGLGTDIERDDALALAQTLKRRAVRELTEAIRVAAKYEPMAVQGEVVVHDSEGAKRPDGTRL